MLHIRIREYLTVQVSAEVYNIVYPPETNIKP